MAVKGQDISAILGTQYESCYHEVCCEGEQPVRLFVKRNPTKGVVIVQWEYDGNSQWSFLENCGGKTANEIACELAEQVKGAKSYNDLSIRILQYTTPL